MRPTKPGLALVVAALALACGDDDNTTNPQPTPDFTMQVSPTTLEVAAEPAAAAPAAVALGDVTMTVTVTRSGGFDGAVTVTVEGLPTGVTATDLTIAGTATTGTITVSASSAAAAGTTNLTVRGAAEGITAKTQSVSLVVSVPVVTETFDMSFVSATASLAQGATLDVTLNIDRTGGYLGEVMLTATSSPDGLGVTFDPATTTESTATLQVSAASDLTPQDYTVTATGTGGGNEVTATVTVTVTESTSGSGNVSVQFCEEVGIPVWVAYQDGADPWMRATEGETNQYTFNITAARGGLAYVTVANGDASVTVYYGSQAELIAFGGNTCPDGTATKTLTGSFAGVATGETASVSVGGGVALVTGGAGSLDFTVTDVQDGPTDLLAALTAFESDGMSGFDLSAKKAIIRRGVNYPAGSAIPTLDFGSEGFVPVRFNLTLTNTGAGEFASAFTIFLTAMASGTLFSNPLDATYYFGVPESEQAEGDLHIVTAFSTEDPTTPPYRTRTVARYLKVPVDLTIDMGPQISAVTVGVDATTPYVRPRVTFATQAEYGRFWTAGFNATSGNEANILMFEGYAPGATFDQAVPDFSAVDGWDNAWGLTQEEIEYTVNATGWEAGGTPGQPPVADGGIAQSAVQAGTINP